MAWSFCRRLGRLDLPLPRHHGVDERSPAFFFPHEASGRPRRRRSYRWWCWRLAIRRALLFPASPTVAVDITVGCRLLALYLNVFVAVVQAFQKLPPLAAAWRQRQFGTSVLIAACRDGDLHRSERSWR